MITLTLAFPFFIVIIGVIGFVILLAGGLCVAASRDIGSEENTLPDPTKARESGQPGQQQRIPATPRPSEDDAGTISTPTTP